MEGNTQISLTLNTDILLSYIKEHMLFTLFASELTLTWAMYKEEEVLFTPGDWADGVKAHHY